MSRKIEYRNPEIANYSKIQKEEPGLIFFVHSRLFLFTYYSSRIKCNYIMSITANLIKFFLISNIY